MPLSSRRFYLLLSVLCLLGWLWVGVQLNHSHATEVGAWLSCPFKRITDVPCPGCGLTRGVLTLLGGDILGALTYHPLAIPVTVGLVLTLPLVIIDYYRKSLWLYTIYLKTEEWLKLPKVQIICATALIIIWIYNIYQGR